ncbi:5-hydroxyisourate hydrolase [Orchesella cincta]|uniref:5-hydroxyisourate hydrolase n=1 Tax=Orchesella cincta TaxID=48709 RepID=A0A1D2MC66_ORCCI|nr:5-hydroxyisourate hydrolase [Orchesella cincta]
MASNPLTSHVLDTATGKPAVGIPVTLSKFENDVWRQISRKWAFQDTANRLRWTGWKSDIIEEFTPSKYKLTFETLAYYEGRGEKTFYPYIDVIFEIERSEEHYHVPILLSAYGYSTYRGS